MDQRSYPTALMQMFLIYNVGLHATDIYLADFVIDCWHEK